MFLAIANFIYAMPLNIFKKNKAKGNLDLYSTVFYLSCDCLNQCFYTQRSNKAYFSKFVGLIYFPVLRSTPKNS
jgi:hypothetical protein